VIGIKELFDDRKNIFRLDRNSTFLHDFIWMNGY
jgi:hypothetical protein